MTVDPDWRPLFASLPEFDPDKCIAIGDLLATGDGPSSLRYSADFREAAARRVARLSPLKKDAKAQVAPRRGLLMARNKCFAWMREQGIPSRFRVEYEAAITKLTAELAAK